MPAGITIEDKSDHIYVWMKVIFSNEKYQLI